MAADAVGCAGVNTPLVTYCDGPDARVAREGNTTSTQRPGGDAGHHHHQANSPTHRDPHRGQVLEHFHFNSAQPSVAKVSRAGIRSSITKSENALELWIGLKNADATRPLNSCK